MSELAGKLPKVMISDEIQAFVARHGNGTPRFAVFSTFDFDQSVFCRALQPLLCRRRRAFGTMVLADASRLQSRCEHPVIEGCEVQPVRCVGSGVFHPKVVFIRAGDHCLAGVGSANLTRGGMGGNLEFMHLSEESDVVGGVAGFLGRLACTASVDIPISAKRFIKRVIEGLPEDQGGHSVVMDTLDRSLLSQMSDAWRKIGGGRPELAVIVSPWHSGAGLEEDGDPRILKRITTDFRPLNQMCVYTDRVNGKAPRLAKTHVFVPRSTVDRADIDELILDDVAQRNIDQPLRRLHAKAYLFSARNRRILFFGSANCTQPALLRATSANGNVEVLIASVGLRKCDEKYILADLNYLFREALRGESATVKATRVRPSERGRILCGEIVKGGRQLRVEAPRFNGAVKIAAFRGAKAVDVRIRSGRGYCSDTETKRLLQQMNPEGASANSAWTAFLYECGRSYLPFPVSMPVSRDQGEQHLCDALIAWLAEEKGIPVPVLQRRLASQGKIPDREETTDDEWNDPVLTSLTECRHQGLLDRIAVRLAALVRCICSSKQRKEYATARLLRLRSDVKTLTWSEDGTRVPRHIEKAMSDYIAKALIRMQP